MPIPGFGVICLRVFGQNRRSAKSAVLRLSAGSRCLGGGAALFFSWGSVIGNSNTYGNQDLTSFFYCRDPPSYRFIRNNFFSELQCHLFYLRSSHTCSMTSGFCSVRRRWGGRFSISIEKHHCPLAQIPFELLLKRARIRHRCFSILGEIIFGTCRAS